MYRVSTLVDTVVNTKQVAGFFLQPYGDSDSPLPVDTQLDGTNRADGCTSAAEGALLLIP
jgi:hypothetical protein